MNGSRAITFEPIGDIHNLDLSRHALVEASAGTGKTYTIENLVVRLLKEEADLQLDNILLVTFTEKATSELKLRIRQKIEQTLDSDQDLGDDVRNKLGDTLDEFDNAAIYTIHGFCHRLLKEFPFETGNLFQQEKIDDGPLLERLIKDQMRVDWPKRYGRRLETLLAISNFSANPDGFVETIVDLVRRLSGDPIRERLIPDPGRLDVDKLWQAAQEALQALKKLVGTPPCLAKSYGRLNINARTRAAIIRDVLEPVEQALNNQCAEACRLSDFKVVVKTLGARHSSGERNIDRLVPQKWLKAGDNLDECPHLVEIRDRLDNLVRLFADLSHVLTLTSMGRLRQDARAMKAQNGWISYQDMLVRVADFLVGEGAEEGIRQIRRRYRVAFVDEFQDTDDLQWRIFRILFLHGGKGAPENRLFLIGDPKQAIYAFRGADVFTYLAARQHMQRLAGQGLANLYDLAINWRSTPELVTAFNRIFAQKRWFGTRDRQDPFEIGYTASGSPPAEQLPAAVSVDRSKRPAFNVMDLSGVESHAAAKALMAGFICREIRFLVEQAGMRMVAGDGGDRALHFGDFAILVRSQSEFALIEPLLNDSGIPYAYYRKPGLFKCREAHWLALVLRAVANPQQAATTKLALLTPFFDVSPAALASLQELPPDHPSQSLLARWHAYAHRRRWGPLFQSMMEASGLVLRHCTDPAWERTATNFQQLCDYLEASAFTRNLDITGLVALLDSLRLTDAAAGTDEDIHQIGDEGDKVQILTMHVSKGLEFPVVFIAGGLTVRAASGMQVYHSADPAHPERGCVKVVDLTTNSGKAQAEKENEDENKRLYYVALTRSKLKLYVPYFPDERNHKWLGPICRFVSQSISHAFSTRRDGHDPIGWHRIEDQEMRIPDAATTGHENGRALASLPTGHLLPAQTHFRHRRSLLESFSSIGQRIHHADDRLDRPAPFRLMDAAGHEDDEPAQGTTLEPMDPDPSNALPGGTQMGSMFHYIFENIDFEAVVDGPGDILADDRLARVIKLAATRYHIERHWTASVARMVAATLRTPIEINGNALVLGRLTPPQRRHEIEFHFPLLERPWTSIEVPGCTLSSDPCRNMVIRGFIDLVFFWQGRYYILDWKSNRLETGYDQKNMALEMASAGYALQYQFYTIATLRWLQQRLGKRFDSHRHFGGALYLFIRGMERGGQEGIFHVTAEQLLPQHTLQESIQKQVSGIQW